MKYVHLLILNGMADWEPGFVIAHINRPMPGISSGYYVKTVGLDRTPIRTMGGLTIVPDMALSDLVSTQSAMLILPGADLWMDKITDPMLLKAREFVENGVPVAAICGATFGLARVGLLDDRKHTSNDPNWLASSGYRGNHLYRNEPVVKDREVITASMTSSLEFAKIILETLEILNPKALAAWYGLFKTGSPACYLELMEALEYDK